MASLHEMYQRLQAADHEKVAAPAAHEEQQKEAADGELLKLASSYDGIGRALARQVYGDLHKEARAQVHHEKLATVRNAVLERMASDPQYVDYLVRKHGAGSDR